MSVVALVVLGGSVAAAGGGGPADAGGGLETAQVGGATVLVNGKGFTLYWFARDTPGKSNCEGTCAQYWIPLKGPATLNPGVTGQLGTIKRPDGSVQATFDGHPLYTYVSDTAPGQNSGDGVNLDGGLWHEVKVS